MPRTSTFLFSIDTSKEVFIYCSLAFTSLNNCHSYQAHTKRRAPYDVPWGNSEIYQFKPLPTYYLGETKTRKMDRWTAKGGRKVINAINAKKLYQGRKKRGYLMETTWKIWTESSIWVVKKKITPTSLLTPSQINLRTETINNLRLWQIFSAMSS